MLSRLGSVPVADAIVSDVNESDQQSGSIHLSSMVKSEMEIKREFHRLNDETVLTAFQHDIWNELDSQYVMFSGPTSSGKSRLLKEYMKFKYSNIDEFQAIYIVPTRALISEVSGEFRSAFDDDIIVQTGAFLDEIEDDQFLLVLTPERCLNLFDSGNSDILDIDLVFLDEVQNLESNSRGALFENVLGSIHEMWPEAQILGAGPYISNPGEILSDAIGVESEEIETSFTPVVHLEAKFVFERYAKYIDVWINSLNEDPINRKINKPTGLSYSTTKKQTKKKLVEEFGEEDQIILYSTTRKNAENAAISIEEGRSQSTTHKRVLELKEFLQEVIHEEYSLARCLEHKVAFHHGRVPEVARHEIESLYRDEVIDTIACTPTLLEGVNLPAEKMFIIDPGKGIDQELSSFEFQNLTGRVGRVGSKLFGTVIYVDQSEDNWTKGRLKDDEEKEVVSATKRTIQENWEKLINNIDADDLDSIEDDALRYTITILRNKYLKSNHDVKAYLKNKNVDESEINCINNKLDKKLESIQIPEAILKRNPTVDPVLQDRLYKQVKRDQSKWDIKPYNLQKKFFYVVKELNKIFSFVKDKDAGIEMSRDESEVESRNINELKYTAYFWLSGQSYKEIINKRENYFDDEDDIDKIINDVMSIVNKDVRFITERYFKILCDILSQIDDYDNEFMLNFDKRLERGVIDSTKLKMIDMGIDRSIALNIDVPSNVDVSDYLRQEQSGLSNIYKRHLKNQGIL